jgi:hypothetical protein
MITNIFTSATTDIENPCKVKDNLRESIKKDLLAIVNEEEVKDLKYELFPYIAEKARNTGKSFEELFAGTLNLINSEHEHTAIYKKPLDYVQNNWSSEKNEYANGVFYPEGLSHPSNAPTGLTVNLNNTNEAGCSVVIESYTYNYDKERQVEIKLKYHYYVNFKRYGMNLMNFYDLNFIKPVNLLHNLELAINHSDKYVWEKIYENKKQFGGKMRLNVKNNGDNLDTVFEEVYKKFGTRAGLKDVLSSMFFLTGGTSTWGENIGDSYSMDTYDCIFGIFTGFKSFRLGDLRWGTKPDTYKDLIENLAADAESLKVQAKMMEEAVRIIKETCEVPANKLDPSKKVNFKNLTKALLKNAVINDPISYVHAAESDVPMTGYHANTPYKFIAAALSEMSKSAVSGDKSEEK